MAFDIAVLIGRIFIGIYYIMAGFHHFTALGMMTEYAKSKNLPLPKFGVIISAIFLILSGLSFALGVYPVIGVWLIIIFLIPASLYFHNFWALEGEERMREFANFLKNLALIGAALVLLGLSRPWTYALLG